MQRHPASQRPTLGFTLVELMVALALGLQLYQSKAGNTPWNLLMAASVMVTAPVLLLFLLTQKTFVAGISAGGVKE